MNNLFAVVPDANVLIALCARENDKLATAETAFDDYTDQGYEFFAPSVLVAEVIFVLCQKLADGSLTQPEYEKSIKAFKYYLNFISLSPNGEASLMKRAVEIREGYGCSRSSDGLYLALAEELAKTITPKLLLSTKALSINPSKMLQPLK